MVKIVDPILDAASGTFRIILEIQNDDYNLTSGLRCQVSFLDKLVERETEPVKLKQTDIFAHEVTANDYEEPDDKATDRLENDTIRSINEAGEKAEWKPHYLLVTQDSLLPIKKAIQKAETFKLKGVKDTWVIAKGSLKGHISLGYFKNRSMANHYQQQLTDLGIKARIIEQ